MKKNSIWQSFKAAGKEVVAEHPLFKLINFYKLVLNAGLIFLLAFILVYLLSMLAPRLGFSTIDYETAYLIIVTIWLIRKATD